jgi:hypothetical protein
VLGLPETDAGMSMAELGALLHPDDLQPVVADTAATLGSEPPTVIEARYRRPDGTWRHVLMHRAVQRDHSGKPVVLIAVGIDITERIEQRQQAEQMVRRFELVTALPASATGCSRRTPNAPSGALNCARYSAYPKPTPCPYWTNGLRAMCTPR